MEYRESKTHTERHVIKFTRAEVIEALVNYACVNGKSLPEGKVFLWVDKGRDRDDDNPATIGCDLDFGGDDG